MSSLVQDHAWAEIVSPRIWFLAAALLTGQRVEAEITIPVAWLHVSIYRPASLRVIPANFPLLCAPVTLERACSGPSGRLKP
jgi:hypothetical protein